MDGWARVCIHSDLTLGIRISTGLRIANRILIRMVTFMQFLSFPIALQESNKPWGGTSFLGDTSSGLIEGSYSDK